MGDTVQAFKITHTRPLMQRWCPGQLSGSEPFPVERLQVPAHKTDLMTPWGNWIFYVTHMDLLIVEQTCCLNPSWYECIFTCTHIASMQMIFTNKFIDFALSYCNCDLHLYLGCTCQFPALLRGFLPCTAFSAHSNKSRTVFISPLLLSSDNMTLVTAKNRGEREGQLACSFTLYPFFTI